MSAETNKATIRRMVEDFNRRDLTFVDEVFSPHFVLHTARTSGWPQGLEGARQMFTTMLNTAPDIHSTIEDLCVLKERRLRCAGIPGTHRGESLVVGSPTNERFNAVAIALYRFVNGHIAEDWGVDAPWETGEVWK